MHGLVPYAMRDLAVGDVWILGDVTGPHGISAVAMHLVGRTWRRLTIPEPAVGESAVLSDQDIWVTTAATCSGTPQTCTTGLLHWNGSDWSTYTVSGEIETLAGWDGRIWAAGINDIRTKVIKKTRHGVVEQVTGKLALSQFSDGTWQPVAAANPTISDSGPIAFAAAGPDGRLWVVTFPPSGRGTLRYWTDGAVGLLPRSGRRRPTRHLGGARHLRLQARDMGRSVLALDRPPLAKRPGGHTVRSAHRRGGRHPRIFKGVGHRLGR